MRTMILLAAAAAAVAVVMSPPAQAASTSPGKHGVYASEQLVALSGKGQLEPVITATISKGKRNRVLVADVMLAGANHGGSPTQYLLAIDVNGIRMEPSTQAAIQIDCGESGGDAHPCVFSGTWWLDLDAAEKMNPGAFASRLLTIKVLAADVVNDGFESPTDVVTHVSLAARMEEK